MKMKIWVFWNVSSVSNCSNESFWCLMYFVVFGVLCIRNWYFEYDIRILCLFLYIWIWKKCDIWKNDPEVWTFFVRIVWGDLFWIVWSPYVSWAENRTRWSHRKSQGREMKGKEKGERRLGTGFRGYRVRGATNKQLGEEKKWKAKVQQDSAGDRVQGLPRSGRLAPFRGMLQRRRGPTIPKLSPQMFRTKIVNTSGTFCLKK